MPDYPYANASKAAMALGAGKTDDEVWKKFGLYKTPMANGRTALIGEIPDNTSSLKNNKIDSVGISQMGTAGSILQHPELFRNMPSLQDVNILGTKYDNIPDGLSGVATSHVTGHPQTMLEKMRSVNKTPEKSVDNITVNYLNNKDYLSSILHELQHAIQDNYGLANGNSNVDSLEKYVNSPGEESARAAQVRALVSYEQIKSQSPKSLIELLRKGGLAQPDMVLHAINRYGK
jgi:hypothetical protein